MHTQEKFLDETGPVMFTSFPDLLEALRAVRNVFGMPDHLDNPYTGPIWVLTWHGETPESTPACVLEVCKMGERWIVCEPIPGGFKTLEFSEEDLAA